MYIRIIFQNLGSKETRETQELFFSPHKDKYLSEMGFLKLYKNKEDGEISEGVWVFSDTNSEDFLSYLYSYPGVKLLDYNVGLKEFVKAFLDERMDWKDFAINIQDMLERKWEGDWEGNWKVGLLDWQIDAINAFHMLEGTLMQNWCEKCGDRFLSNYVKAICEAILNDTVPVKPINTCRRCFRLYKRMYDTTVNIPEADTTDSDTTDSESTDTENE